MSVLKKPLPRFFRTAISTFGTLLLSIFTLSSLCFLLMHLVPGGPFQDEQGVPEEVMRSIDHQWGLDRPLYVQYGTYVWDVLHGNLGTSMRYPSETVWSVIHSGFPISIRLGIQALCFAVPSGIAFGMLAAIRSSERADIGATLLSMLGLSVPSFVIASCLQLVFAVYFPVFPVARWGTISHTVLPSIALSIGPACAIGRIMRASALDVLTKDWVLIARMKGLPEWKVLLFHVLPNALPPIFQYLGPTTANLLVGSFVVERIFSIPGLGQWFVMGVISRDYPVIIGLTLFYSLILFFVHALIDIATALCNSQVSEERLTP